MKVAHCIFKSHSTIYAENCLFIDNKAREQGGVVKALRNVNISIENSTFTRNFGKKFGGAISITDQSNMNLLYCSFEGHVSQMAAAVDITHNSYLHMEHVEFWHNKASFNGAILNIKHGSVVKMIKSSFRLTMVRLRTRVLIVKGRNVSETQFTQRSVCLTCLSIQKLIWD